MEEFILAIYYGILYVLMPYQIYCMIRNNKYEIVKVYLLFYTTLMFVPLVKLLFEEELDILGILVQILNISLTIFFVRLIYKKDYPYKRLYKAIAVGKMKPFFVTGISTIKHEDIEYFHEKIEDVNDMLSILSKKVYINCSFEGSVLKISILVKNLDDYTQLCQYEFNDNHITIKDTEQSHGGGSVTFIISNNT